MIGEEASRKLNEPVDPPPKKESDKGDAKAGGDGKAEKGWVPPELDAAFGLA